MTIDINPAPIPAELRSLDFHPQCITTGCAQTGEYLIDVHGCAGGYLCSMHAINLTNNLNTQFLFRGGIQCQDCGRPFHAPSLYLQIARI